MTMPAMTEEAAFEPSPAQLDRALAIRRFNRLFIFTPIAVACLIVVLLLGLLLWGVLSPNITGTREFVSALADIIMILTIIPMLLLCAVVPGVAIAFVLYKRDQPKQPHGRIQSLLWRLDSLADRAQLKTDRILPKLAKPVIEGHAIAAYARKLFEHLKTILNRS